MLKVIFGVGFVALVLQFAGTSAANDTRRLKFNNTENLNMEKMLGQWYVVRSNDEVDPNPCYLIEFHKDNKFSMHMCVGYEAGFSCFNISDLTITDRISGEQIYIKTKGSLHYEFSIPETDYDNYAVIELQVGRHLDYVLTLSRNNVLDAGQLDKLTRKYIGTGIMRTYNSIEDCPANNATHVYVDK